MKPLQLQMLGKLSLVREIYLKNCLIILGNGNYFNLWHDIRMDDSLLINKIGQKKEALATIR